MWPTSAPRGPPFSVLKGESARTIAVFLGDRKANFHVCADTMHRSLSCSPVQIRATASFHTAAIVPDPSPLYSFLFMGLRARSFCVAPAIFITTRRTKIRQGGGGLLFYLFIKYYIYHALLGIYMSRWENLYEWNAPRRMITAHVSNRIYASIHPAALTFTGAHCGQGSGRGGKTTTRTAIGMNTRIYNEKSPKMSHIKYPLLISGCLTPTRERLQSKRRFLKLWHHLTCLDVATKYYSHFSSIAWARKNYSEVCCTQGRHSPFSSAFYASIILHRAK